MAKTIVVGDDDLVITVRNERIEKIAGEVVYAEPVLRVLVGNTPIGMLSTIDLHRGTSTGLQVRLAYFEGMSPESLASINDRSREVLKGYLELLAKLPFVQVVVPEIPGAAVSSKVLVPDSVE